MKKNIALIMIVMLVIFLFQLSLATAGTETLFVKGAIVNEEIPLKLEINAETKVVGGSEVLEIRLKYSDNEVDLECKDILQFTDKSLQSEMYLGTYNIKEIDWGEEYTGTRFVFKAIGKVRGAQTGGKWVPCTFALALLNDTNVTLNEEGGLFPADETYDIVNLQIHAGYYGNYNGYETAYWVSNEGIKITQ
jgi:hypothetical protein